MWHTDKTRNNLQKDTQWWFCCCNYDSDFEQLWKNKHTNNNNKKKTQGPIEEGAKIHEEIVTPEEVWQLSKAKNNREMVEIKI